MNKINATIEKMGRPLLGVALHTYNPAFVEIAGLLGFHIIWIEMEHAAISFAQAVDLCRVASGMDLLTMIRIPDSRRENVLKAAECGPDIIDLPMGDTPEVLRELVQHARYAPYGNRGFFSSSRATRYGVGDIAEEQKRISENLCLLSQIETVQAVKRADELCSVPGVDGVFIGPGDLSTSMGLPGQMEHPNMHIALEKVITTAKEHGKLVALAYGGPNARMWVDKGVDILFCASETACLKAGAQAILAQVSDDLYTEKVL